MSVAVQYVIYVEEACPVRLHHWYLNDLRVLIHSSILVAVHAT